MKLSQARVVNYRSIDDSSWVKVDDVTALVGKNESGKTAFLQAIRKINSISGEEDGFTIRDYPRKGYIKYKKIHEQNPCEVAQAEFELSAEEVTEIEANFGNGVLASNKVIVTKIIKMNELGKLIYLTQFHLLLSQILLPNLQTQLQPRFKMRFKILDQM